jgi:hypothetical protein
MAHWGVQHHDTEFASAVCLQLNTYLRPGVVVELTTDHVVPSAPNAGRAYAGVWGLNLAPSAGDVTTKTGTFDESVLIGDVSHHWINEMMRLLYDKAMERTGKGWSARLFPTLTLNRYERSSGAAVPTWASSSCTSRRTSSATPAPRTTGSTSAGRCAR